jgi:GxxExxY protein
MTEILFKELSFAVIGAAMEVHKILGPGFLEAIYQAALEKELMLRGIPFQRQFELPVRYKGDLIGTYKADLVIDGKIIIEIKVYLVSILRMMPRPFIILPQHVCSLQSLSILG